MKKTILLLCVLMLTSVLWAQADQLSISIIPNNMIYNYIYPANFNPNEPMAQPILIQATVTNNNPTQEVDYEVSMRMSWAGNILIDNVIIVPYVPLNAGESITITKRHILS